MTIPAAPPQFPPPRGFKEVVVQNWAVALVTRITEELVKRRTKFEPSSSILIQSPGNKIYSITVDDAGVISTTLVQG